LIGQLGLGGTEKQLLLALKYLVGDKLAFHVISFNESPFGDLKNELIKLNVKLYNIPKDIDTIFKRIIFLYKILKKISPEIIHSWTIHDNVYAALIGRILNVRLTMGSIRGSLEGTSFSKLPKIFKWSSLHLVDIITTNTESLRHEIINNSVPRKRIRLIRNGIETNKINQNKSFSIFEPIICTIGNLRINKNHECFMHIIHKIRSEIPNVRGWIIGQPVNDEPFHKHHLKKVIKKLKIEDSIELLGYHPQPQEILEKASVFILPSMSEGSPNVILEAMSVGVPVVASNVGGIPEIISTGKNGYMFNFDDIHGFSDAVIELIRNNKKREKIIKNGYLTLKKHNPKNNYTTLKNIYKEC